MKRYIIFFLLLLSTTQIYSQYAHLFGASSDFQLTDLGAKLLAHWPNTALMANIDTITGAKVTSWHDVVNNKHFTQSTDANRPIYDKVNKEIDFNEGAVTTQGLVSSFARTSSDITVFMVMKNNTWQDNRYVMSLNGSKSMYVRQAVLGTWSRKLQSFFADNLTTNTSNYIFDTDYHIFVFEKKGTACNLSYDTNNFTENYSETQDFNITSLVLANASGYNWHTKISVKEIIITTGTLTRQQKFDVINTLNKTYQLSQPAKLISASNRYNSYIQATHTVVPDSVDGQPAACTGITWDPIKHEIYVVKTINGSKIRVFDESFNFKKEFTVTFDQGIAKDYVKDCFYAYTGTSLVKADTSGNNIWTQTNFNSDLGWNAGHITLDYSDTALVIWASAYTATNIAKWVYNKGTDRFVRTAIVSISNGHGGEGIAYDSRDNTLWIHNQDFSAGSDKRATLVHIAKDGQVINTYSCQTNAEGIVVRTDLGLIYSVHDSFYHGGTPNGNVAQEYYPDFLSN